MSDEYTINLYFDRRLTEEERTKVETRLSTAFFKDTIDEEHNSLLDFQTEEDIKTNRTPTYEEALQTYLADERLEGVSLEWEPENNEAEAMFSGWDCCYSAVKKEAKKIMREVNKK
jgi:hypothetical protein